MPAAQAAQTPLDTAPEAVAYIPRGHGVQSACADRPSDAENVPAAQAVHADAPLVTTAYVPASHTVQRLAAVAPSPDE